MERIDQEKIFENERIKKETDVERTWWSVKSKFPNQKSVNDGLERKEIVLVPIEGVGWKLIGRLCPPDQIEPRWVRPKTLEVLNTIASEWSLIILEAGGEHKLAVTSLGRTLDDQLKINDSQGSYRSAKGMDSSHLAGAAFDISLRSYYSRNENGKWTSIRKWESTEGFNESKIDALIDIVKRMHAQGDVNVVVERNINANVSENSVLHICVSPNI